MELYVERRYFTIYIIFNDKIATEQCCYNIRYRLHDVTALSEDLKVRQHWRQKRKKHMYA
jgi:P2-related tail formation protein